MKLLDVFIKSMKEQLRRYWILILIVTMVPFFILVYYLMNETLKPSYKLLFLNNDRGTLVDSLSQNYGLLMYEMAGQITTGMENFPVVIQTVETREKGIDLLKNKKADVLVIIPEDFSACVEMSLREKKPKPPLIEFMGDISDYKYMLAAIWGNELISSYLEASTGLLSPFVFKETPVGISGTFSDFDLYMPGMMILALVMLMFSASIAIVVEIENKTITRFRLSGLKTIELLTGISAVQVIIGLVSLLLSFVTANALGFNPSGSLLLMFLIAFMAAVSIIAFSLILAAVTRSANDILVIGNFPLFLFMFFTGAAFPIEGKELFSTGGYPFTIQGIMSPTHAVSAMKKVMIMDLGFKEILPELLWLFILTIIYFAIGVILFNKRHMKLNG